MERKMENINFQLDVVLDTNATPLTQRLLGDRVKALAGSKVVTASKIAGSLSERASRWTNGSHGTSWEALGFMIYR